MSVRSWAEALAIMKVLDAVENGHKIKDVAKSIDKIIDERWPKRTEEIQKKIREVFLYPLIQELGQENPDGLKAEVKKAFGL